MKEKTARQNALLKVITAKAIETQEELAAALAIKGFKTTQATLSRDLKELNVSKARTAEGKLIYTTGAAPAPAWPALRRMADSLVSEVRRSGNLLIIKTMPGYASGVAAAVDNLGEKAVLGSVAGDDTILVVTADEASGRAFAERIRKGA